MTILPLNLPLDTTPWFLFPKTYINFSFQKEEEVRNCQNECRSLYDKALKVILTQSGKCFQPWHQLSLQNKSEFVKRAEQKRLLEEEKERLKRESNAGNAQTSPSTAKELQKLDLSIRKAITAADTSRQQCVNVLEQLDVAKEQWESKTAHALTVSNDCQVCT